MALDDLIARITEEANREVARILDEAKAKAETIIDAEKQKAKLYVETLKEKGQKDQRRIKEKILASARRQARMHISNGKEEIITQCIQEIRNTLINLKGKEYQRYVHELITHTVEDITDYTIIGTRKEDEEIAKKFGIKLIERREGNGGIILKSVDGYKEIDLRFDFILEQKKDDIRVMIAQSLFGSK